jgi:hypothetical protein
VFNLSIFGKKRKNMDSDKENVCIFYLFFHRLRWLYNFFQINPAGSHISKKHCIEIEGHVEQVLTSTDNNVAPLHSLPMAESAPTSAIVISPIQAEEEERIEDTNKEDVDDETSVSFIPPPSKEEA